MYIAYVRKSVLQTPYNQYSEYIEKSCNTTFPEKRKRSRVTKLILETVINEKSIKIK